MCFTIAIETTREYLEKRFNRRLVDFEKFQPAKIIKAFSIPRIPVICSDGPGRIELAYWGLIPNWVKDVEKALEIRKQTFNARAETLTEKPSFRHNYLKHHCLILATGFYEWHTEGKKKTPYFIKLCSGEPFALAGLFDYWTDRETGEQIKTVSIITTQANSLLEKIHNTQKRMPVILSAYEENNWLDVKNQNIVKLLKPCPDEWLEAIELNEKI